ncbi:MAG: DNA cytosine methyltransferase [Roseovarius sp.]|nr:DNA cytosine methyltransferase [Roseovarius sp.]
MASTSRCVTVREMARLHRFPEWFCFHVTKWHGARQIANAVPPPMALAIAAQIAETLDFEPARPAKALELGDGGLLSLEMKSTADHFGL